ncbi:uncharacterized protein LOC144810497 [Lissotriton helveticus]
MTGLQGEKRPSLVGTEMELDTRVITYGIDQVNCSTNQPHEVQGSNNRRTDGHSHIVSEQGDCMQQPPPAVPSPYRTCASDCSDPQYFASDGDQQRPALTPVCELDSLQSSRLHISSNEQGSKPSLSTGNAPFQSVQSPPTPPGNELQQNHQSPISSRNVSDFSTIDQDAFRYILSAQGSDTLQPSASAPSLYGTPDFGDPQHSARVGYQQSPMNIPGSKVDSLQRSASPSSPLQHISVMGSLSASAERRNADSVRCGSSHQFGNQNGPIRDNQHVLGKQHQFTETSGVSLANQEYSTPSNEMHLQQRPKENCRVPLKCLPKIAPKPKRKPHPKHQQGVAVQNTHNQAACTGPRAPHTNISTQNSHLQLQNLVPLFVTQQRQSQLQHQHTAQFEQVAQPQVFIQPQQSLQCQWPLQLQPVMPTLQPAQFAGPWQLQEPVRLHCPQQLVTQFIPHQQILLQQLLQPQQPLQPHEKPLQPHEQPLQPQRPWQLHQRVQLEEPSGNAAQHMQSQHTPVFVINGCYFSAHQPTEITTGNWQLTGKPYNMDASFNESFQPSGGNASFSFTRRDANVSYEFTEGTMGNNFQNAQQIYSTKSDLGRKCADSLLGIPAAESQMLGSPLGIPDSVSKPLVHSINSTASLSHSEAGVVHKDLPEMSKEHGVSCQNPSSIARECVLPCSPHSPNFCTAMPSPSINDSSVYLNSMGGSCGLFNKSLSPHDSADPQCPEALGSDRVASPQSFWRYSINETNCMDLAPIFDFQSVNKPEHVQQISTESTVVSSFDQCDKSLLKSSNDWVSYGNEISSPSKLKADRTVNSNPVTSEHANVNLHTSPANVVEHFQEKTNSYTASIPYSEAGNQTMLTAGLSPSVTKLQTSTREDELNVFSKVQGCSISASVGQSWKTTSKVTLSGHNPNDALHPNHKSFFVVSQPINPANSATIIPSPNNVPNLPALRLEAIAVKSAEIEGTFPEMSTDTEEAPDPCLVMLKYSPSNGDRDTKPLPSTTAEQNRCDVSSATTVKKDQMASTSIPNSAFTSVKASEPQIAVVNPMIVSESEIICIDQANGIPKDGLNRECDYLKENKQKMMLDTSSDFDGAALTHYLPWPKSNLSVGKLEYNSSTGCTGSRENVLAAGSFYCGVVKQREIDLSLQVVEEASYPEMENECSLHPNSLEFQHHRAPEHQCLQSVCGADNTRKGTDQANELHISSICTLVEGSAFYDPQIAKIVDAIPSTKAYSSQISDSDTQESPNEKDQRSTSNKTNRTLCMPLANGQIYVDTHLLKTKALSNDDCSFTAKEYNETISLTNKQIHKDGTCKIVTGQCGKGINHHEAYLPFSGDEPNEENRVDFCPLTTTTTKWECNCFLRKEKNVQDHIAGKFVGSLLLEGVEAQHVEECIPFMTNQIHKENNFANDTVSAQDVSNQLSGKRDLVEQRELPPHKPSKMSPVGHLSSENQDLDKGYCANGKVEQQSTEKCPKLWINMAIEQPLIGSDLDISPIDFSDNESEGPINNITITLLGTDQMHALFPETAAQFAIEDNMKCSQNTSHPEKEPTTSETVPISEPSNTSFPLFQGKESNFLFSEKHRLYSKSSLSSANHCSLSQENKNQRSLNSEEDECIEIGCSIRPSACATNSSLRGKFHFRCLKENIQPNMPSNNLSRSLSEDKCRNSENYFAQSDGVKRKKVQRRNSIAIAGQNLVGRDRFHLSNEEMSGKIENYNSKKPRNMSNDKHYKVNAPPSGDCKLVSKFKDRNSPTDITCKAIPIRKFHCPDAHKGFVTDGIDEDKRPTTERLVVKIDLLKLSKVPDGAQNMHSTEVSSNVTDNTKKYKKTSTNGIGHAKKYMLRSMSKRLHSKTENGSYSSKTETKVSVLEKPLGKQELQKEKPFEAQEACSSEVEVASSLQFQESSVTKTCNSKSGKGRFDQYKKRIVTIHEYRQHQKTQLEKAEKETLGDKLKPSKPDHKKKIHTCLKRKSSAQSHQACLGENMFKCLKSAEAINTSVETCQQKAAYPRKYKPCGFLNDDKEFKSKMVLQDKCVKLAKDPISSDKVTTDWQKAFLSAKPSKESNIFCLNTFAFKTPHLSSDTWKNRLRERKSNRKILPKCQLTVKRSADVNLKLCSSVAGLESRNENVEAHLPLKKRRVDQSYI